jgi:hypothetical protein
MAIFPHPVVDSAQTQEGAAGVAAAINIPAPGPGLSIYLCSITASYDGAAVGALMVNVGAGGHEWKRWVHNAADILFTFANRCGANQPVAISLAAVVGRIATLSCTYRIGPS